MSVDRSAVARRAEEGDGKAAATLASLRELTLYLSGIQLAVTAVSLILGYIAAPAVGTIISPLFAGLGLSSRTVTAISTGLALAIATCLQMVLGELIPKNAGIARPLEVSGATIRPLRLFVATFRPVIRFLTAAANATVKLVGITPRAELVALRSIDELDLLIASSRREGAIPEEEFALLARSIDFRGKTADDAMIPRVAVEGISQTASLADLTELALRTGHSRFPVYSNDLDNITGVVHIKDSYAHPSETKPRVPVSQVTAEPMFVPESKPLQELLPEMRQDRIHLGVVLDEYGGTAGIVTLEDILEEIVGEIEDEHDPSGGPSFTAPASGVNVLSGLLHHAEVEEACGLRMPDDGDYETLGGFVLDLLGRIPREGDHAIFDGWELKVVKMDGNRVSQVLLVAPTGASSEEEDRR